MYPKTVPTYYIWHHRSRVIAHCSCVTAHCSPLIAYVLASLARAPWFHAGQGTLNPAPAFLVSMEAARWLARPGVATV